MKVVTFERNGARSYGLLENDRVIDVGSRLSISLRRLAIGAGRRCVAANC